MPHVTTEPDWEIREAEEAEEALRKHQMARAEAVQRETDAMRLAFTTLQPLDRNARKRALRWIAEALEDVEVPF